MAKKGLISKQAGVPRSIEIMIDPALIPPWKKRMSSDFKIWAPADATKEWLDQRTESIIQARKDDRKRSKNSILTKNSSSPETIYRFKITLTDTEPPVWRQIETHNASIDQLHGLIQTAMGWTDSHQHEFMVGKNRYSHFPEGEFDNEGSINYANMTIVDWIEQYGNKIKMRYMYDFGDGWEHDIKLVGFFPAEPDIEYPRCTAGAMACPPEDIGGIPGYYEFIQIAKNPLHDQYEEMIEDFGLFDPEKFNLRSTTYRMQVGL